MSKKKQQRNGFFYYMLDLQQELREGGREVPMRDMPIFAGPSWSKLSDAQKQMYNHRAKAEKAKASGAGAEALRVAPTPISTVACGRRDAAGNLLSERVDVEAEEREKKTRMIAGIQGMLSSMQEVTLESFWVMDIQSLCHIPKKPDHRYLPCELAVVRYCPNQGVLSKFHSFIKPGNVPIGYRYLAQTTSEATNQIPVDGAPGAEGDYRKLLGELERFLTCDGTSPSMPPVFAKQEFLDRVEWSLQWLADNAGVTNRITRVYELESLLDELTMHCSNPRATRHVIRDLLSSSNYSHDSSIRCDYHDSLDISHCSLGISHTYCYVMSEVLCPLYNISITRDHFSVLAPLPAPSKRPVRDPLPPVRAPPRASAATRPISSARGTELQEGSRGMGRGMGRGVGRGIAGLELREPRESRQPPAVGRVRNPHMS